MVGENDQASEPSGAVDDAAPPIPEDRTPASQTGSAQSAQEVEDPKAKLDRDLVRWTRAVALLTAVLALAAVASDFIFFRQLSVMQADLEDSVGQQRAWLSASVTPGGPMSVNARGADVPMNVALTNVGRLPALNVEVWSGLYPITLDKPSDPDIERTLCPESPPKQSDRGFVIFPSQTITVPLANAAATFSGDISPSKAVNLALALCVFYSSGESQRVHRTAMWHSVYKTAKDRAVPFDPSPFPFGTILGASEFIVFHSTVGDYAD